METSGMQINLNYRTVFSGRIKLKPPHLLNVVEGLSFFPSPCISFSLVEHLRSVRFPYRSQPPD